jgi:cytochrome P450
MSHSSTDISQAPAPRVEPEVARPVETRARCPVDHPAVLEQKTARTTEAGGAPTERDAAGIWHVRKFADARTILRSTNTKQAGFRADVIERLPGAMNLPMLYQEGKAHQLQRKQTARFFTPSAVSENYRELMEVQVSHLVADLRRHRRADLSQVSMTLAVRVAAEVVGLTNSRLPGMDRRLNAFFADAATPFRWSPRAIVHVLRNQWRAAAFFFLDVRPAIAARKRRAQADVITHLIEQGYTAGEILTECITYGAAGMATTREFICIAVWHLLEQPALRSRFLAAPEAERHQMLEEILRLEPVVGHLYRRATADIPLDTADTHTTIPAGDLIDVHLYAVDADEDVVGDRALALCPSRELRTERVPASVMGFGDGHHRCAGSYVAIQETDIFLRHLLALDGLRIERGPSVSWNDLVPGYELRDFILTVD